MATIAIATRRVRAKNEPMPPELQNEKARTLNRQKSPLAPFVLIPKIFFTRYKPSWKAILVYTALKYYSNNESGYCEGITMKTFAERVGIGWRTYLRGLDELEKKGAVVVKKRSKKSANGGRIPLANLYELIDLQAIEGEPI